MGRFGVNISINAWFLIRTMRKFGSSLWCLFSLGLRETFAASVVGEHGYEHWTKSSGARGLDEVGQMVGEVHRTQGSTRASFAGGARLAVDVEAVL